MTVSDGANQGAIRLSKSANLYAFLGGADYTVKFNGYSAEDDQKNGSWSVSVEFLYNPKGWAIEYYDVGFNELPNVFERAAIVDKAGNPVSKPVALNLDGTAKDVGEEPDTRKLFPYKVADFQDLFSNCRI
jgi:hypothetical protein